MERAQEGAVEERVLGRGQGPRIQGVSPCPEAPGQEPAGLGEPRAVV